MVEPGTIVGGFRIERRLPGGSLGVVYEATQLSLGRSVALRLLQPHEWPGEAPAAQRRLSTSVHHPHIVPTYEAGAWGQGGFVATRFVRGQTLAGVIAAERPSPARLAELLSPVADALDAIHRAGLTHGRVTANNVMVDAADNVFLADLGLETGASAEDDRRALAGLERLASSPRRRLGWPLRVAAAAGVVAALVGLGAIVAAGGEHADAGDDPAPPAPAATAPLGSELAPGPSQAIGCGDDPGPNTPACTLVLDSVGGAPVVVREAGVVRGWALRGAAGAITLQVVGRRDGDPFLRSFSQVESPVDGVPEAFPANIPVERGDQIGVLLAPGATAGVRPATGAAFRLRAGTIPLEPAAGTYERLAGELLLRVDIEPGAEPEIAQLVGERALEAPAGDVLGNLGLHLPGLGARQVEVVEADGAIALDLLRGGTRVARVEVPDLRVAGALVSIDGECGFQRGFCLRWLNEGESVAIVHAYRLDRAGRAFELIG
jgi:Protein kinase domain